MSQGNPVIHDRATYDQLRARGAQARRARTLRRPDPTQGRPAAAEVPVPADLAELVAEVNGAPAEGLGDTIAAIAHRVGADRLAAVFERLTGLSCGCEWRQTFLNRLVPYRRR